MGGLYSEFDTSFLKNSKCAKSRADLFSLPAVLDMNVPKAEEAVPNSPRKSFVKASSHQGDSVCTQALIPEDWMLRRVEFPRPPKKQVYYDWRPSSFAKFFAEGFRYLKTAQYEKAIKCFENAQKLNPGHEETQTYLFESMKLDLKSRYNTFDVSERFTHMRMRITGIDTTFMLLTDVRMKRMREN
jgi:tetratricopeptide (TPR) repeat protein